MGNSKLVSQKFMLNSSWTAPAGITSITVEGFGGGGGGGGGSGGTNGSGALAGGGGGGGGSLYYKSLIGGIIPGNTYTIVIGAGGSGGVAGGAGSPGSPTQFKFSVIVVVNFPGAAGGQGGFNIASGNLAQGGPAITTNFTNPVYPNQNSVVNQWSPGSGGHGGNNSFVQSRGVDNFGSNGLFVGGVAGTSGTFSGNSGGSGGGGGGAGPGGGGGGGGDGGNGTGSGAGGTAFTPANSLLNNGCGGGGGGAGGNGSTSSGTGATGAAGGSGLLVISWVE